MKRVRPVLLSLALFAGIVLDAESSPGSPPRRITMHECVEEALRNNIDVAVAAEEKTIAEQAVPIEEAAFLPRFTGEIGASRAIAPSDTTLTGTLSVDQRLLTFNAGVSDLLPGGTTLSLGYESRRQEVSSAAAALTPQYSNALTLSARQPLLANRGRRVTEAPLAIARAGAAAGTEEWKTRAMDVAAAARAAFLAFHAAHREAGVRRGALELAEKLLEQVTARIEAGAAPSLDWLPAEAAVAARREELIRAEAAARGAEDDLKNVLGVRAAAEWDEEIVPADLPAEIAPPGPDETFEEAIRRRPEAAALAAAQTQAEIREAAARNRAQPSLDLTASGGLTGLAGTPNPNPLFPFSQGAFEGDSIDSLDRMVSGRYYNFFIGLRAEIPWRLDREKAEWVRARAAVERQRLFAATLESRIRLEIRKARRDLEAAIARIAASRASVAAAQKKLEAEEQKLALGRSTVPQVLTFQQDLEEARLAEIRAQADAHAARTRLERAAGTILEKEGIVLR